MKPLFKKIAQCIIHKAMTLHTGSTSKQWRGDDHAKMCSKARVIGTCMPGMLMTLVNHPEFLRLQYLLQTLLNGYSSYINHVLCAGWCIRVHCVDPESLSAASTGLMCRLMKSIWITTKATMITGPPKVLKLTQPSSVKL